MSASSDLRELAAFGHTPVRPANLRYPDVAGRFVATCRLRLDGVAVAAHAGQGLLLCELSVEAPVVLALGRPDDHLVRANVAISAISELRIFSSVRDLAAVAVTLAAPEARERLAALTLADDEQVVVAQNITSFVMRPSGLTDDLRRLSILIVLLGLLRTNRRNGGGEAPEPPQLTPLAGVSSDQLAFLALWAISDDEDREHALEHAEEAALVALACFLSEYGEALDERIGELETTDADGAALWGAVGETCAEARIELARRRTG